MPEDIKKYQITDTLTELEVLYEIAMSIGTSLDLQQMLKTSLKVYLRKLNCSSGLILKKTQTPNGIRFVQTLSIPRNAPEQDTCQTALNEIPEKMTDADLDIFLKQLPIIGNAGKGLYYYLMNLPGFGLLVLIKNRSSFETAFLKSLRQVNHKLAASCIACEQNTRLNDINTQLHEEIRVRETTEERLKLLTNELEQRVEQRTEDLNKANSELKEKIETLNTTQLGLKTSEEKYRSVMEATPDPVIVYDMKGRVLYLNPSFARTFGWTLEELIHTKIDFVPEECKNETLAAVKRAIEEEHVSDFESRRLTKGGEILEVSISSAAYRNADGKISGIVVNLRDMTELKKARELLVQTEKMLSVGGLAAGMAHEINNPLAGILQTRQVIQNRLFKTLPVNLTVAEKHQIPFNRMVRYLEERKIPKLLDNIQTSGAQAAQIVEDMLSFSRKGQDEFKSIRLDKLVDQSIDLARHDFHLTKKYDFKAITINRRYPGQVPEVSCIPNQIQQVIFNILKNAAYAMFHAKKPENRPELNLCITHDDHWVILEVADNGPGIPEEIQKRVFEPFYTTKDVGEGTGLGLSVAYFIIRDRHKGMLILDSAQSGGARFLIKLPVYNEERQIKTHTFI